jgi:transposase
VDVSSQSLDARIGREGAFAQFSNTAEGIAALRALCQAHQVELIAMEATGGYEQQAFAQLSEQGLPVAILNPRAVRLFAQSMGSLEKTDRIDAGMIAWYAEVKKSRPACVAPESQQHLRALVTRLRQLTDIRTAQLNQQRLVTDRAVQSSFKKLLDMLARQIRELEKRIAALLDQDPLWRELNQEFRTIKGVADRTVAALWRRCRGPQRQVFVAGVGCRRSACYPTRPSPNWPESHRWPATRASTRASAPCVGDALQCVKSCSSWPA